MAEVPWVGIGIVTGFVSSGTIWWLGARRYGVHAFLFGWVPGAIAGAVIGTVLGFGGPLGETWLEERQSAELTERLKERLKRSQEQMNGDERAEDTAAGRAD